MSCIHLKVRTEKYEKYFYCKIFKSKINLNFCKECEHKEYKKINRMNCKKHKRTKSTAIQKHVKEAVWYRDNKECIFCHKKVSVFYSNAHYIKRSQRRKRNRRKYFYSL